MAKRHTPRATPQPITVFRTNLRREFLLEWRQKSTLSGLLLYAAVTVFILALVYHTRMTPFVWNVTFWTLQLFVAVNTGSRIFNPEQEDQTYYYYQLTGPRALATAKAAFATVVIGVCGVFCYGLFVALLGNPIESPGAFLGVLALNALSLGSTLTLMSALAAQTTNRAGSMAILAFPLVIPQQLTAIRLSAGLVDGIWKSGDGLILAALAGISWVLLLVLFPFVWQD
jgi:heme exporter protein B